MSNVQQKFVFRRISSVIAFGRLETKRIRFFPLPRTFRTRCIHSIPSSVGIHGTVDRFAIYQCTSPAAIFRNGNHRAELLMFDILSAPLLPKSLAVTSARAASGDRLREGIRGRKGRPGATCVHNGPGGSKCRTR